MHRQGNVSGGTQYQHEQHGYKQEQSLLPPCECLVKNYQNPTWKMILFLQVTDQWTRSKICCKKKNKIHSSSLFHCKENCFVIFMFILLRLSMGITCAVRGGSMHGDQRQHGRLGRTGARKAHNNSGQSCQKSLSCTNKTGHVQHMNGLVYLPNR